ARRRIHASANGMSDLPGFDRIRTPKRGALIMSKSAKSRAEAQFTATQRKDKQALKEREKAEQERAQHTARLKALRLAKEAVDKEEADKAAAEKAAAKAKKTKKPAPMPEHHRQQS